MEDTVGESSPVGVELFSYVNASASEVELHISSSDLFRRKRRWFSSTRRGYTAPSQTTAFCPYGKSYTFREDMSTGFLNAINTDFKLENN